MQKRQAPAALLMATSLELSILASELWPTKRAIVTITSCGELSSAVSRFEAKLDAGWTFDKSMWEDSLARHASD